MDPTRFDSLIRIPGNGQPRTPSRRTVLALPGGGIIAGVTPGGTCTECDCCGNYYCAFDDNNNPSCQPNPEG